MVAGLVEPTLGQITVDNLKLGNRTLAEVRPLGYVIQEGGLFPHLTAAANVTIMAPHEGWSKERSLKRLAELVEMTRFPADALDRYPNELSGGQRQRLSLMRAFFEPAGAVARRAVGSA